MGGGGVGGLVGGAQGEEGRVWGGVSESAAL